MTTLPGIRARIFIIVTALVAVTSCSCMVSMWYIYRTQNILSSVIEKDFAAVNTAQQLNYALVMQKGFVTYFFLDADVKWLNELVKWNESFADYLNQAYAISSEAGAKLILNKIEEKYTYYNEKRAQVISLYRAGDRSAGSALHKDVRKHFFSLQNLCAQFKETHEKKIVETLHKIKKRARVINSISFAAITSAFVLGVLLVFVLLKQVLKPIEQLIIAAGKDQDSSPSGNEMTILKKHIYGLLNDVDRAKIKLEKSHEHLLQSEKLAMVGRLAAGMAHGIRNPLTSVKMRLFSMERKLEPNASASEDFGVISHEIDHIESIVRNFLEFSRPPKIKTQMLSPSHVVDMALQLLKHRIDAHGIEIKLLRQKSLPLIEVDPEQLKEVFVNIVLNGCEAMKRGGAMIIQEKEKILKALGPVVTITFNDSGPGIPSQQKDKVFEPFFSTKDEGTGLGLSISARIVENHGGFIELDSEEGKGASFTITLPIRRKENGNSSDS